tara:strand:- start:933 stop:2492 length:1560 start_codon:yes stop_codon:yes gene_type:complete
MAIKIKELSLPRLAWIAEYSFVDNQIIIHHGQDVEIGDDFAVEGVWDGRYEDFDFDTSNHFFGSGLKIKNNEVIAVPSTGLVDRVFIGESKEKYFISNSLIEILARTNSKLIPSHNYKIQTNTIQSGINKYINDYPISSNTIARLKQYFYNSIIINGKYTSIKKRPQSPNFLSYEHYISTITSDLSKISSNASSPHRNKTIDLYTTVSKGYDSTAVTALTADLPIKTAFTSKTSNSSVLGFFSKDFINDDGTEIAEKLGLNVTYLDFNDLEVDNDELYFLAATTGSPELQLYKMHKIVASNKKPGIIFTGYHGDTVWGLAPPKEALTDDILKPGASGLTLSEVRLKSGFIDVPVPMMYARSIVSINHLSASEAMSKWSVGGDYDRPIPRRIVESRGIGRDSFGRKKRAIAKFYDLPRNNRLRKEFLRYMRTNHNKSSVSILVNHFKDQLEYYLKMFLFTLDQISLRTGKFERPLDVHTIDTPYHMHIWALAKLVEIRAKELDSLAESISQESNNFISRY